MKNLSPGTIYVADMGALTALMGSFLDILPTTAALLAVIWYAIQIWESKTVRRWFHRDTWEDD